MWKQDQPQNAKREIRNPNSYWHRQCPPPRQGSARYKHEVVRRNQQNGKQCPCRAPAAPWLRTKRNRHQGEENTRERERDAPVQFDPRLAPSRTIVSPQFRNRSFLVAERAFFRGHESGNLDWQIALAELRYRIVIRILTREFMRRSAAQMQLQLAELRLGNYNRVFRQGQLRTVLVPGFRQEHTVPFCPACGDVIDVKYCLGKTLVKNARLISPTLKPHSVFKASATCASGGITG